MAMSVDEVFDEMTNTLTSTDSRDLLVYLHVPFCRYRCTFCDWIDQIPPHELISRTPFHDQYVAAICRQIRDIGPRLIAMGYIVRLVYWGGGTPTVLEPYQHAAVMETLRETFDLTNVIEHSLESTPDALTVEKARALKALGVGRISVGVQSMDPDQLRKSGRRHSVDRTREVVDILRAEGIENFNLDVIVGLPDQTRADVLEMIDTCIALNPTHMSVYPYRPSAGTQLAMVIQKGRRQPLARETSIDLFLEAEARLRAAGYQDYITGYFAKNSVSQFKGEQYYFGLEGDFIGFGAGAASILCQRRLATRRDSTSSYVENPLQFSSCDKFSRTVLDPILPLLRPCIITADGIRYDRFRRLFGFEFAEVRQHPVVRGYLDYFRACGADLIDHGDRLAVSPETRTMAHLNSYGASVEYKPAISRA